MKQLLEDIKTGQFRQAYLLYGQEAYLRNQYRDRLKAAMVQEGDTISIDFEAGIVYRNGEALEEPYIAEPTWTYESVNFPITVPEGCLFIMGDNRNNSKDSRDKDIGCVDTRDVLGVALWRIMPFGEIGAVE